MRVSRKGGFLPRAAAGLAASALLGATLLLTAPPALAAVEMNVREVHPGTLAAPAAEFVELQTPAPGQHLVAGERVTFYGANGAVSREFTLSGNVANGDSQRTILLATQQAGTAFPGFPVPDFNLGMIASLSPAAGAVCFPDLPDPDCVTWGTFTPQAPAQFPDPQSTNAAAISDGMSLTRDISRGCATVLDGPDDTDSGAVDFDLSTPSPRNNAGVPSETPCPTPPNTEILARPAAFSPVDDADFTYAEVPGEGGVTFECRLDGASFLACPQSGISYGSLADGSHTFRVRAINGVGPDPTPAFFGWTVDTVVPDTSIDSTPPDPSPTNPTFTYHANEVATFQCRLDEGPVESCPDFGKAYVGLSHGSHTFRVWATDPTGHVDQTPAAHTFTVDDAIGDRTSPETTILSSPSNPSPSSSASFTYGSNESGASFQCRLGDGPFAPCPSDGANYADLRNDEYSFEVRAVDRAGNVDPIPATHSWRAAAPLPETRFTKAPPGRLRSPRGKPLAALFAFASSKEGSSFRCRLDLKGPFRPCRSPQKLSLKPGRHVFEVFATDRLGNEGPHAFRLLRVDGPNQNKAWFVQSGRFLSSFGAQIAPTALPRKGLRPVTLSFSTTFENLDGSDIPALRSMTLELAKGGVLNAKGLPRCAPGELNQRTSTQALAACRNALVGEGTVQTALRFPEGGRLRADSRLLLFNSSGGPLMHIYATNPLEGTFVVPLRVRKRSGLFSTVLTANFPKIAAGFGHVTGFRMKLERRFRHAGKRQSYLLAGCPAPRGSSRAAFVLARIAYRFDGGLRLDNSSFNTCRAIG